VNAPSRAYDGAGSLRLITHGDGEPLEWWTFVPDRSEKGKRSTTAWISVDPSAVVDLADRR
jgi:hypothetical protein